MPCPARYSSPVAPAGTGRSAESSRYARVLPIGRPTTGVAEAARSAASASTVYSVGPYRFTDITPVAARTADHSASGTASPPSSSSAGRCAAGSRSPWSSSPSAYVGVTSIVSIRCSRTYDTTNSASRRPTSSRTCSSCPATSQNNCSQEVSKLNDAVCSARRRRPPVASTTGPNTSATWLAYRLDRPPWVRTTPLGRPVEPDV